MSYALKVIKDNPIMFLPLDETSGSVAYDISGCGNNGTHSDGIVSGLLPLIPGGATGTTITNTKYVDCSLTKNYYGQEQVVSFGQEGFSDNDFSMEIWVYPKFNTSENLVFGDQVNDIGISWHNGNIIFKLQNEILEYTVPYYNKAIHIVSVYDVNSMSIYLDGQFVATKQLNNFKFTNTYLNISIGPTSGSNSYFVVDAPAIYRYALNETQIKKHFFEAQNQINPSHIVIPDGGTLFKLSDENTRQIYKFSFPGDIKFESRIKDGLSYDTLTNSLYMTTTDIAASSSIDIIERIGIPTLSEITRTKIRWVGDNGITVSTSIDGISYEECSNGSEIPQYSGGDWTGYGDLYIKITFTSSDTSRYNPELSSLWISFYDTNKIYAENYGEYVDYAQTASYNVGDINYPILSADGRNGLSVNPNKSFRIDTIDDIMSVEMFYTRYGTEANSLVSFGGASYSWDASGAVSLSGISSIHINGVNRTSATNIANILTAGNIFHIVIVLSSPTTGILSFNENSSGLSLYKNIATYRTALSPEQAIEHYQLYTSRPYSSVEDNDIAVSESGISQNTNDWIVLQSI